MIRIRWNPHRDAEMGMSQIDLEEWIAADEAARAAAIPSGSAENIPAERADTVAVNATVEAPGATDEDTFKFLKEAVHFQEESTAGPQYDYRYLLHPIQRMLAPEEGRGPAVCACGHARGKQVGVHLVEKENGTHRASVTGIYRCRNGEVCPVCARHIAALRAKRYRLVHEAVTARGGRMVTLVLTIEHDPGDRLADLLRALKAASTGVRSEGRWTRKIRPLLKAAGVMIDPHVRRSRRGGWHPHLHVTIACLTADLDAIKEGANLYLERFVVLLSRAGYHASRERQSALILDAKANAYPAHHHRRAKIDGDLADDLDDDTSLSPFDIAELAAAGDAEMRALFVEFAEAMRGSKSGIITASMAKALGIEAGTDPNPGFDESTRIGGIPSPVWTKLMELNLNGTFLTQVETGGRAGWRRSRWWALQQTGFAPPIVPALANEMTVLVKAIALLTNDEAKAMAKDVLADRLKGWTAQHGHALVVATLDYAEAHAPLTTNGDEEAESLAAIIETWAGKAMRRRRWQASRKAHPVAESPPRTVVPIG